MPIKVKPAMKYISRIDSFKTHTWYVRAGYGPKECTNASFCDNAYGGKRKALKAAQAWRDKEIKRLAKVLTAYRAKQHRFYGKGYSLATDKRFEPHRLSWVATFWSKKLKRQINKSFCVNRYGYNKAKALAKQHRHFMVTGKI